MENNEKKNAVSNFFSEFKAFINKGNVMDLAVGVIIGGAFASIVSSLVDDIIMPFVGMILAGVNFKNFGIEIPWGNRPFINIGSFIQAIIIFLLTALCVFFIIKAVSIFHKKEKAEKKPSKEEELLTEIRDLLKAQSGISDEQSTLKEE